MPGVHPVQVYDGPIRKSFERLAATAPNATALVCGATAAVTTRQELLDRSFELARQLREQGLTAGDAVAVQLTNSPDFVAAFLAALEIGATFVPIDRDARQAEVAAILQQFGIATLIYRSTDDDGSSFPTIIVREIAKKRSLEGVALLKLTSGSTGLPKGILTSEANLIADCRNICSSMRIAADDRNLGAIPFSHSYGFSNLVTPLLIQGTAIVYSNDYVPMSVLSLSNRFGVTVLPGIPLVFEHLSRLSLQDGVFSTVRTFISAGAPLAAATSRRFRERFGKSIQTFYGCSECGGITFDRTGGAVERGLVGEPMDGVSLKREGEHGRLVIESKAVAIGYFDPLQEKCDRFSRGRFLADDIVEFTSEGEVSIVGRLNDLINIAGKKVNPREIEAIILTIDGVQQVKVYGSPAGARGEVVAAAVVATPEVTREHIREYCRRRLSAHKIPRIIKLIDAIPVDERGKVKRSALAEL